MEFPTRKSLGQQSCRSLRTTARNAVKPGFWPSTSLPPAPQGDLLWGRMPALLTLQATAAPKCEQAGPKRAGRYGKRPEQGGGGDVPPYGWSPRCDPMNGHPQRQITPCAAGIRRRQMNGILAVLEPYNCPPLQRPIDGHLRAYPQPRPIAIHLCPASTHLKTYARQPWPHSSTPETLGMATKCPIRGHLLPRKPASGLAFEPRKGLKGLKRLTKYTHDRRNSFGGLM